MSVRPHCRCFQLPRQREPRPLRRPARAAAGGRARRGERGMAACVSQGDGDLASSRRRRRGSSDAVALTVDPDHRRAIVFRTAARRHRGRARHVARRPAAPRALRVALGRQAARPGRFSGRRRAVVMVARTTTSSRPRNASRFLRYVAFPRIIRSLGDPLGNRGATSSITQQRTEGESRFWVWFCCWFGRTRPG